MSYQCWEALENETYKDLFQLLDSLTPDKLVGENEEFSSVRLWKITCSLKIII